MRIKILILQFVFIVLLCIFSCSRDNNTTEIPSVIDDFGEMTQVELPIPPLKPSPDTKVAIYFENSYSMDGYVPDPKVQETGFRDVLRKLLIFTANEYRENDVSVLLINNEKTYPTSLNSTNIGELNANTLNTKYSTGRDFSDFDKLIGDVLEKHDSQSISILIADFIYSPSESDTESSLTKLKDNITGALLAGNRVKKDINIKMYRMISDFHGTYYDLHNRHIAGIGKRPYFIFVIAGKANLNHFETTIENILTDDQGFQNSYSFENQTYKTTYSVLPSTLNKGRFLPSKKNGDYITAIKYKQDNRREHQHQLAIAVDMHNIPAEKEYLLDTGNYKIEGSDFSINQIGVIQNNEILLESEVVKIKPSDLDRVKGCSHVLILSSQNTEIDDIKVTLENNLPQWINQVSTDNDSDIKYNKAEQLKTLGFNHIVGGIYQATNLIKGDSNYFSITIPVKMVRSKSSAPWIVLISLIVGFTIGYTRIKNKQRS